MIAYPITFETQVSSACGMQQVWQVQSPQWQAPCAIPPEFEGPGGAFSPEDLFAQALTNCFVATFQVLAEKSRVSFENLKVKGKLTVDRDELKRPVMRTFHFQIQLFTPSDKARSERLVQKALETGFILNSVKTTITHEILIS